MGPARVEVFFSRAPVAQLDRVPDYESVGRRFESCRAHQKFQWVATNVATHFSFWDYFAPLLPRPYGSRPDKTGDPRPMAGRPCGTVPISGIVSPHDDVPQCPTTTVCPIGRANHHPDPKTGRKRAICGRPRFVAPPFAPPVARMFHVSAHIHWPAIRLRFAPGLLFRLPLGLLLFLALPFRFGKLFQKSTLLRRHFQTQFRC